MNNLCAICNTKESNETFISISDPLNISEKFNICRDCREKHYDLTNLINEFFRVKLDLMKQYSLISNFLKNLK